jgi:hypothetical protein
MTSASPLRVGDELVALRPGDGRMLLYDLNGLLVYEGRVTDSPAQVAEVLDPVYAERQRARRVERANRRASEMACAKMAQELQRQAEHEALQRAHVHVGHSGCAGVPYDGLLEYGCDLDLDLIEQRAAAAWSESSTVFHSRKRRDDETLHRHPEQPAIRPGHP